MSHFGPLSKYLVDCILAHVPTRALPKCALVSSSWRPLAQRQLFYSIFIMPGETSSRTLCTVLRSPQLACYVKSLTVYMCDSVKSLTELTLPRLVSFNMMGLIGPRHSRCLGLGILMERFMAISSLRQLSISIPGAHSFPIFATPTSTLNVYKLTILTFTYDGLAPLANINQLLAIVGQSLKTFRLRLQTPVFNTRNGTRIYFITSLILLKFSFVADNIESLDLDALTALQSLVLDYSQWRRYPPLLQHLSTLSEPVMQLQEITVVINDFFGLRKEVWRGVEKMIFQKSPELPPVLRISVGRPSPSDMVPLLIFFELFLPLIWEDHVLEIRQFWPPIGAEI